MMFFRLLFALAFFATRAPLHSAEKSVLRAGAATSNITPELGWGSSAASCRSPRRMCMTNCTRAASCSTTGRRSWPFVVCDLLGIAPQRERRGAENDSGGDGHSAGAGDDLLHAHALCRQRAGAEPLHLRTAARRLPAFRRAPDRGWRASCDQRSASGADRLRHRGGAGACLQPPLVHARGHRAGESIRQGGQGEDESARRQPEPHSSRRGRPIPRSRSSRCASPAEG